MSKRIFDFFFFAFQIACDKCKKKALDNRHNYIENKSPNIWEPHVSNFKNSNLSVEMTF